jgi:hypothetical protein
VLTENAFEIVHEQYQARYGSPRPLWREGSAVRVSQVPYVVARPTLPPSFILSTCDIDVAIARNPRRPEPHVEAGLFQDLPRSVNLCRPVASGMERSRW